jgi:uncharacterized membrane protein YccC
VVGYLIFTGLGIDGTNIFDWVMLSALIGTVIALLIPTLALRRSSSRPN